MKSKISRFLTTLVALIAMTAGAWATDANTVVWNNTTWSGWTESQTTHTVGDITITATGSAKAYQATSSGEPLALQAGANDAITFTSNGAPFASVAIQTDDGLNVAGWTYNSSTWSYEWSGEPTTSVTLSGCDIKADQISFTFGTAATAGTALTPDATRKVWTLDAMPAGNVVLHVEYEPEFTATFKAANALTIEAGKATVSVTENGQPVTTATLADGKLSPLYQGQTVILTASEGYKFRKVEAKEGGAVAYPLLSAATTSDQGKVVCAAGHLHDAKTAVPDGCTAVGILGKVTETGHGLILALKDATSQTWNTINDWASASYAGTTLKVLPDNAARGSLTSYTTLGETTVSNWAVAQKSDYDAIFTNLGSTVGDSDGMTYDGNVNAYITTGVGGTAISGNHWSATENDGSNAWDFRSDYWSISSKTSSYSVRPVLGF